MREIDLDARMCLSHTRIYETTPGCPNYPHVLVVWIVRVWTQIGLDWGKDLGGRHVKGGDKRKGKEKIRLGADLCRRAAEKEK